MPQTHRQYYIQQKIANCKEFLTTVTSKIYRKSTPIVESVQDFLIKLGIKPLFRAMGRSENPGVPIVIRWA